MIQENKLLKLLVIEDQEDDVLLITTYLEIAGYKLLFKQVDTKYSINESILQENWDLIISDFNLPDFNAFDVLEIIKKSTIDIPVIVVSGVIDEETAIKLMKEGAHDFIIKSNLNRLVPVIERELRGSRIRNENIISKRKLQESEEFNRAAINSIISHLAIIDENGFIMTVNSAWNEFVVMNGGNPEKIGVGANYFSVCLTPTIQNNMLENDVEIAKQVTNGLKNLISGNITEFSIEYPCDSIDEKRWFLLKAVPFLHQKGKVLINHINITDQKLAAESLERERNFMSVILNTVEALIITLDRDGRIISFNRACEITTGYHFDEVKHKNVFDLFVPQEYHDNERELFKGIIENKSHIEYENYWLMKDGSKNLFNWNSSTTLNKEGKVEFIICTGINITHKRLSENALHEQAALLEKAQDAIIVRDLDYNVIYWNKSSERLYGWTEEEVLNKNAIKHLYIEDTDVLVKAQESIAEKGEWLGELRQLNKSGKEIFVQSRWNLIHDNNGNAKSILTVNTDITEKKKIEAQLLRSQRIESIGTLTSGIAHDLNNIFSPILIGIEILKLSVPEQKKNKVISTIETCVRRGSDIINKLLVFARGESGREKSVIKIDQLIYEVNNIIKETFPKSISLSLDIPNELWSVEGDSTQLVQMLLNLCVNSRDAMPDGGKISISANNIEFDEKSSKINIDAKPIQYILIKVIDTGIGISSELIDKIFEPFFTTKEIGKGTGLGLSTLIGIVKSHGGFVNVYSELNKGTQFNIYLPAIKSLGSEEKDELHSELLKGNGELLLLIDDEVSILDMVKASLETFGYNVMTANSGTEALETYIMNKNSIKVIITDISMPGLDGLRLSKLFQEIDQSVKVIFASGLESNKKVIEESSINKKVFMQRPYNTNILLKNIKNMINS